ncbi:MAG: hypothetical protein KZQ88_10805 [Candidatus Thiodiazotropha sp. (ex Dulcina madagascariensis)]|nr:hypothetical protein [Candidatus Thiodiazotropha sp. (ex Dulcina madagascariensis)]MCU7927273.1 hypothetical protein [Candidatus Thiodiazotropha sp. (ex Dulcina madagascariensis)]
MALNTHTLVAISFAMGAGAAVITMELIGYPEGDAGAGLVRVEATAVNPVNREPVHPVHKLAPSNTPSPFSSKGVTAAKSDQIASTPVVSECAVIAQWDNGGYGRDRENVLLADLDALDPALLEERDPFAITYEREQERLFQEEILAMEEEENLYGLPPSDYELSADEQDALEQDSVNDSVSVLDAEDAFFQQQILDNEAELDAEFGEQSETWEDEED